MQSLTEDLDCPLKYEANKRHYILDVPQRYLKKNEARITFTITYCPRCGAKLPEDLVDKWWDIVEEKFGIDGLFDKRIKDLPEEFKTDEWWKKRGL